jgi:cytochrome c-type biogenesis protein CcmH/NrfG
MSAKLRTTLTLLLAAGLIGCAHMPWSARRIKQAQTGVLAEPDSTAAWMALGDAYARAHAKKKARSAYTKVLAIDPELHAARQALSELQPKNRVSRLERKALRDPTNDEIWGDVADELVMAGDIDKALRYYVHALRIDPTDEEWISKVMELGGEEVLLGLYKDQMHAQPNNDELMGDYADLLMFLGRRDEACMAYQRAQQLDPEDSEWGDRVAECSGHGAAGAAGVEGATSLLAVLEARIENEPQNDELLGTMGDTLLSAGDAEGALVHYRKALAIDPGDSEWLDKVVALSGQPKLDILLQLTEENSANDELWGNLGDVYLDLGMRDQARDAYRKAATLDPSDSEWARKLLMFGAKDGAKQPSAEEPAGMEGGVLVPWESSPFEVSE